MNSLIKATLERKSIVIFIMVLVILGGVFSYYRLPKQENPDVSAPMAMVVTVFPGASASDVDELVSKKVSDKLSEIEGCKYTECISKESVSIVLIEFNNNVDCNQSMQSIRNAISDIDNDLPTGVTSIDIKTDLAESAGIVISLSSDKYTYEQLAAFGEQYRAALLDIDGVSKFNIEGELKKEVHVEIDIAKLNQLNVSMGDLKTILAAQNLEIPSGNIDTDYGKIQVKTPGAYASIEDIRNIIVAVSEDTGIVTTLNDIGTVSVKIEEDTAKYRQNSKKAILLTGFFEEGKNIVIIGKDVRKTIDTITNKMPSDLIVEEIIYQPQDVANSTNDFVMNLIIGVILVVVVVFIGMGIRNAVIVSTAIPMSILGTFIIMYISKVYIHQISLAALIIALGILVDNAIVISDAIQIKIDNGITNQIAALEGAKESALPIFSATLITVAAISPLLFMPGAAGEFVFAVPFVLIASVILAYLVSMFVTPALASIFFKKSTENKKSGKKIRLLFERMLNFAIYKKKATISILLLMMLLVFCFAMPNLTKEFFPNTDKSLVYIDVYAEGNGTIEKTETLINQINTFLAQQPEVTSLTDSVGTGIPKFYTTMVASKPSKDYGMILCKFNLSNSHYKSNEEYANYLQELLDKNISGGKATVNQLANAFPGESIRIIIRGDNAFFVKDADEKIYAEMKNIEGVKNLQNNSNTDTLQLLVNFDEDKALNLGVTKYDVQSQINIALYGSNATVYRNNGHSYNVNLSSDIKSMSDLENLEIKSSITGKKIPLKQFANITYGNKTDAVNRYDGKKSITITANTYPQYDPSKITDYIENKVIPNLNLENVQIKYLGERSDMNENVKPLLIFAGIAVVLIYIILLIQFNSFIHPAIILITIPLSVMGSIVGLLILGQPLSFTALLGIIALIGLVVKNGILLIEYIEDARARGLMVKEACIDAVDKRFSPIILGAATTVLGLFPLAISGSALFAPMSIALMCGLMVATIMTLIIIPMIYDIVEEKKEKHMKM